MLACQGFDETLKLLFIHGNRFAALGAAYVVVMVVETISQLNFVFPTSVEPLNNAELFKKVNCPVYTRSVNFRGLLYQYMHAHWLLAQECFEHGYARFGNAVAMFF